MAKAQVDGVPLVMKLRLVPSRAIDELSHALQLFFALGHESFRSGMVVKQARLGFLGNEIDHLGEDAFGRMKERRMFAGHAFVPVAKRLPSTAIGRGTKDI